ncbi:hypothetical protein DXG03_002433 [Asterophora parasitica]|uniref:Glucose receptor Git3 N-terminal domain-containing protein n=1 Tax=Asterophora parasitica TaxID=117018 RepID=A0A9P7KCE0_9AGAR|nr:hypothetical protein DXG03_002433 [Asterophora parasitica]
MQGISAGTLSHSSKGPYYGNTGFWCWISNEYQKEKIVFEYLWMWLAAFIMLTLYGIIALVMRGILVVGDDSREHSRWRFRCRWNWTGRQRARQELAEYDEEDEEEARQARTVANLMLFYPAVYIFCVFPVGLVRWLTFSGHYVPSAATIFASVVFSLSGILNTILYALTRPELVRGSSPDTADATRSNGMVDTKSPQSPIIRRHAGHLPDTGDDLILTFHPDPQRYDTDALDHTPWLMAKPARTPSGYAYPASPIGSPENIVLGRLPSSSHDGNTLRPGSSSSEATKHRQLGSDSGHLPDIDFDRDSRLGEVLRQPQHLQIPRS